LQEATIIVEKGKSRPKSWSVRQRSTAVYFLYLQAATISVAERPRSWSLMRTSNSCIFYIYFQAAITNIVEGNKQAKILES
jgi:hypothetical protein